MPQRSDWRSAYDLAVARRLPHIARLSAKLMRVMSHPVLYYIIKLLISAGLIVLVSEVAKAQPRMAGLIASLPLVSYLAIIWLYVDTGDKQEISALSWSVLWLVIPSLSFFIMLPLLLKKLHFVPSMLIATVILFACYSVTMWIMEEPKQDDGPGEQVQVSDASER